MDKEWLKTAYPEHFTPCLKKFTNLVIERAEGPYLYTIDGEKYLDFVQGIAVNPLGHNHPAVLAAAMEQLQRMSHVSFNLVSYPSALNLAAELRQLTPGRIDTFFFGNTGAEIVDGALKLARYVTGKTSFIAFRGSFHGRSMGAASVTGGNIAFRKSYAPFMPQVYFAPYPYCLRCSFGQKVETCHLECLEYLKQDMSYIIPADDVAAIIFEPVQGEGGYICPPPKYVEALGHLAKEKNILVIFDEIQSGIGRTGKFLAAEHFHIEPDIICLGKAVGGGFPLAIIGSRKEIMENWSTGSHGTTFGGHPVACAAALPMLKIVSQPAFLNNVVEQGEYFRARLRELQARFPVIGDVRGLGLMNAIEIVKDGNQPDPDLAKHLIHNMQDRKILLLNCGVHGHAIRFIPPLNIERALLDEVIEALAQALAQETGTNPAGH